MSKFEPDTKINYEGMDEKLKARRRRIAHVLQAPAPRFGGR